MQASSADTWAQMLLEVLSLLGPAALDVDQFLMLFFGDGAPLELPVVRAERTSSPMNTRSAFAGWREAVREAQLHVRVGQPARRVHHRQVPTPHQSDQQRVRRLLGMDFIPRNLVW